MGCDISDKIQNKQDILPVENNVISDTSSGLKCRLGGKFAFHWASWLSMVRIKKSSRLAEYSVFGEYIDKRTCPRILESAMDSRKMP